MREIQLTRGKVALVDDADYEWLNQWKWCANKESNTFYAVRKIKSNGRWVFIRMHRLILGLTDPKIYADHIDGNGLNNQRSNLRQATNMQNQMNRGAQKNNALGIKGVFFYKHTNKYKAHIRLNGIAKTLGYFHNLEEAVAVRREAELKYFGEFARQ